MKRLSLPLAIAAVGFSVMIAAGLLITIATPNVISGTPRPAPNTWSFVYPPAPTTTTSMPPHRRLATTTTLPPASSYGSCNDCGR
jgi:hypothetical protein